MMIEPLARAKGLPAALHAGMAAELADLVPPTFIALYDRPRLAHDLERAAREVGVNDVDGILFSAREGLSYGCGDAVIGVNDRDGFDYQRGGGGGSTLRGISRPGRPCRSRTSRWA